MRTEIRAALIGPLLAGALVTHVVAGPARYDPATLSFRFTYTFALVDENTGEIRPLSAANRPPFGAMVLVNRPDGLLIDAVAQYSPASRALEKGDVILSINGAAVHTVPELAAAIKASPNVLRYSVRDVRTKAVLSRSVLLKRPFGVDVVANRVDGVVILHADGGSPASRLGLEPGDVILSINNAPILNEQAFIDAVTNSPDTMNFTFRNVRTGLIQTGSARLDRDAGPPPDQDSYVRGIVRDVGDALWKVTGQRARIASLDYVSEVAQADFVFSSVGHPIRQGLTATNAIEGRPGHIISFVPSLMQSSRDDAIGQLVHEIGHYAFGLPDEYDIGPVAQHGGCPKVSAGGKPSPGCLMDNFFQRGGYFGLCGPTDHNKAASGPLSCQEIVDAFFDKRGILKAKSLAARDRLDSLVQRTLRVARGSTASILVPAGGPVSYAGGGPARPGALVPDREALRKLVRAEHQGSLAPDEEESAINAIVAIFPVRLTPALEIRLRREASELATRHAGSQRAVRVHAVEKRLLEIVLDAPDFRDGLDPADRNYIIEEIAKKAEAAGVGEKDDRGPPVGRPGP